ncbi:hypothetical protein Mal64_22940 [Pseudobythopirellula maris]|uniref:Lumazine-binding domain protein n=1 Tax=Pseudobythopirellula maris TaxID=2527991 RepID=A0A5C5ZNU5_9BACT|nr:hypothetical protein [Pseudobythopirellula maris]TWT88806.1 hypothetical protein Mal64_22940 [Pseudobythopirellula maris]
MPSLLRKLTVIATLSSAAMGVGCGGSDTPPASSSSTPSGAPAGPTLGSPTGGPIGEAAQAFMRAVIEGDTDMAARQLTPAAIELAEQGGGFSPVGFDIERFTMGEVRQVSDTEAAVQFTLSEPGAEVTEEICCLMRYEGQRWGVAGVAAEIGPGQPPAVISFETPEGSPPAQPDPSRFVDQPAGDATPRTAQAPGETAVR